MTRPIAIAIPTLGFTPAFFTFDLTRLVGRWASEQPQTPLKLFMVDGTYLWTQREQLIEQSLAADASHVLFLDTDMRFPADALQRLLMRGRTVIGVNYSTRREPLYPVAEKDGHPHFTFVDSDPVEEVERAGMGVMLIDTAILKRMEVPRFRAGWNPVRKEQGGEDFYFAQKVREMGEKVWIDNELSRQVAHIGYHEYTMDDAITYNLARKDAEDRAK